MAKEVIRLEPPAPPTPPPPEGLPENILELLQEVLVSLRRLEGLLQPFWSSSEDIVTLVDNGAAVNYTGAARVKIIDERVPDGEDWEIFGWSLWTPAGEAAAQYTVTIGDPPEKLKDFTPHQVFETWFLLPERILLRSGKRILFEAASDGATSIKAKAKLIARRIPR